MKPSIKIEIIDGRVRVHTRMPNWETATQHALSLRNEPPDGYRMARAEVKARSSSGRGNNLTMIFEHTAPDVPPFTLDEAYEFFKKELGIPRPGDDEDDEVPHSA